MLNPLFPWYIIVWARPSSLCKEETASFWFIGIRSHFCSILCHMEFYSSQFTDFSSHCAAKQFEYCYILPFLKKDYPQVNWLGGVDWKGRIGYQKSISFIGIEEGSEIWEEVFYLTIQLFVAPLKSFGSSIRKCH